MLDFEECKYRLRDEFDTSMAIVSKAKDLMEFERRYWRAYQILDDMYTIELLTSDEYDALDDDLWRRTYPHKEKLMKEAQKVGN